MKDPVERLLNQMTLARASSELDDRVDEVIHGSPDAVSPPVTRWLTLGLTAATCLLAGVLIGRALPAENKDRPADTKVASALPAHDVASDDPPGLDGCRQPNRVL